jgi:hypothetical protein
MADNSLEKLKKEAKKLGVPFDDEKVTEEELSELVTEKKEAQAEEDRLNKEKEDKLAADKKKNRIILKNVFGEDMDEKEYFFPGKDKDGKPVYAPAHFNREVGFPVDREDMLEIFNKIFNPDDNFLFYKVRDREMYIVIVPLKLASAVGSAQDSLGSDFQKHAISFIGEGSVNLETLRTKLQKIAGFIRKNEK